MEKTVVQIEIAEYKRLENAANRSDEVIQRLAERRAKEINSFQVRLHLYGTDYDRECPVDIKSYDELTPQMEGVALKVKEWAQEQLSEEFKSWHYMQSARKQLEESADNAEKWQRKAIFGWFLSVILIAGIAIYTLFK